ncbi:DEAD/DEAH box helicase family protein [Deinococcus kurensis]|uniref:DEAD/DEAH box helicase family protein n=1 Tax=Deinococcus kurensis TaxID=2662757 RepID=UPI00192E7382|nr:DEAD/DEAH box helicase family protein [Deinococcus kurensis]
MTADLTTVKGGRLQVHMHPGQARAIQSKARHVLVLAGTQSGKTSFGPLWLFTEIKRCGPGDYLVVAPSFPLLELKLRPEFMRLFDKQLRLGEYTGSPTKKFTFSEAGSRKVFGDRQDPDKPTHIYFGHAQDPDSLESATAKAAWLDEAGQRKFKKGSHEAIMRRLAIHRGRVLYTTTPYYVGWLKKTLHDKADGRNIELINFRSVDNPAFSLAEYEEQKAVLPAWKFEMFYDGVFTRPAGLIYDAFNWETHTCDPFEIPDDWPRVFGLDFGAVNTCCVKFAEDPETGIWYAYQEYLAGGRTAKEHAAHLLAGEPTDRVQAVGGAGSEQNWRDEFTAAGLRVSKPEVSDVEVGIDRAYALLKTGRIRFFRDLAGLVGSDDLEGELDTYSRVLDEAGEPTEQIEDKNRYHRLDAWRYAATLINGKGEPALPPSGIAGYEQDDTYQGGDW